MKSIGIGQLSLLSLLIFSPVPLPEPGGSSIFGVFVATSPCDAGSRPLLQIPETGNCEIIKWSLTLYQNPKRLTPTTYKLDLVYGLPEQGTIGLSQGGTRVERKGKWMRVRGTKTNPEALVYRLDPDKPKESVSLQMVDHGLLHFLDRDERLMIGNAGWSYTLNRKGDSGRRHTQRANRPSPSSAQTVSSRASALPPTTDQSILGRFVGRSPCREVAGELDKAVNADCIKLKWDLTLFRNPRTGIPTTYKLNGTFYRDRIEEGTWAVVKGTKTNPNALVYQLKPAGLQGSLSFLKADDNILFFLDNDKHVMVGNGDFSYTLNKDTKRESAGPSHSIVLRLDPGSMDNPDLEIRWEIERQLRDHTPDLSFFDDGYGFARHSDAMMLSYATSQPETFVEALVAVLQELEVFHNGLANAAMVAVASRDVAREAGEEFEDHRVVYPSTLAGFQLPD